RRQSSSDVIGEWFGSCPGLLLTLRESALGCPAQNTHNPSCKTYQPQPTHSLHRPAVTMSHRRGGDPDRHRAVDIRTLGGFGRDLSQDKPSSKPPADHSSMSSGKKNVAVDSSAQGLRNTPDLDPTKRATGDHCKANVELQRDDESLRRQLATLTRKMATQASELADWQRISYERIEAIDKLYKQLQAKDGKILRLESKNLRLKSKIVRLKSKLFDMTESEVPDMQQEVADIRQEVADIHQKMATLIELLQATQLAMDQANKGVRSASPIHRVASPDQIPPSVPDDRTLSPASPKAPRGNRD
ncbi:hypothetical protein IWX46DRAFT_658715, partial [Phyllosticta citricarpa]